MSAAPPASTPSETRPSAARPGTSETVTSGQVTSEPGGEFAGAAQSFWRVLTKFDHTKVSAYRALRNAAGVVLPLIAGYALGMPRGGLVVASGALNVSYSDGSDPYPQRARRMVRSAIVCAMAVFAGAISGPHSALAILIASLWAFAAGMLVVLGTSAADLGVISVVTLLIYAAQPLTTHQAMISGVLALGGGLFQAALSVALWPVQRYEPERRALATFFSQLAGIAEAPMQATAAPAASLESDAAQTALSSLGQDTSIAAVRYRSLLNQAERIRLSLLMLARLRMRLERESAGQQATAVADEALRRAALALRAVAGALTTETFANTRDDFAELRHLAQRITSDTTESPTSFVAASANVAAFQIDALAGQLRAVTDLAAHTTFAGQEAFDAAEARQPWWLRFRGPLVTLRANLALGSSAFRHAVRLAVMVATADALGHALSNIYDWHRPYWMPMTVVLVLKPEFTTTFSRGLLRIVGTIAG
ncbi:MAG: FUSC family protein, partial [Candidatus Acidiferrum sp.]